MCFSWGGIGILAVLASWHQKISLMKSHNFLCITQLKADIYVQNQYINGKLAAFYLYVYPLQKPDIVSKAGHMGGSAPAATEQHKLLENYKICGKLGWSRIPLVVTSFGAWGEKLQAPSPRMHIASQFPLYPPITSTTDPTCG